MRLDVVSLERDGAVARLALSGTPMRRREAAELVACAEELRDDRGVHIVVVESRADDLCPGPAGDLDPLAFAPDPAFAIAALRQPVVVACSGRVASVGLEVALAGDVRVCDEGATFALPDVAAGRLPSWGGTQRLPRAVGRANALAMILLGEELGAEAALAAGLVHRVAPSGGLGAAVDELVATLRGLAPLALEMAKEAVLRGSELSMTEALHLEGDLNHLLQTTADRAEGLQAFFDKRDPDFAGR
ncbi:MAG TPA: enoyl-CoA hydratase-related protein [Acidimicrobiales bacterium]|nr:enoyl-CoA hydratase-related protein [Acidimicrobiales bacterium]